MLQPGRLALGALVVLAVAGLLYFLAVREPPDDYEPISRIREIHALALNPDDQHQLYVATHEGLVRGFHDRDWSRVGPSRADLMGFTIDPTNGSLMYASGHARGRNLGIQESLDAGLTWRRVAEGIDAHAMLVSPLQPERLLAHWEGRLRTSQDGGRTWEEVAALPSVLALSAHPSEEDVLFAATGTSLLRSPDGGRSWEVHSEVAARALAMDPKAPQRAFLATEAGVLFSRDGARSWTQSGLREGVDFLALAPSDTDTLYAASREGKIHKSGDAGSTWAQVWPTP